MKNKGKKPILQWVIYISMHEHATADMLRESATADSQWRKNQADVPSSDTTRFLCLWASTDVC